MFNWLRGLRTKRHLSNFVDSGYPEDRFYRCKFRTPKNIRSYAAPDILYLEESGVIVGKVILDDRGVLDRDIPIFDGGKITVEDEEGMEKILLATNFRLPGRERFKKIQEAVDFAIQRGKQR